MLGVAYRAGGEVRCLWRRAIIKPESSVPTALICYGDCTPSVSAQRPAPRAAIREPLKRFDELEPAVFDGLPGLEAV